MKSPFWPLPSTFLTGSALAAGLALINSLGNFAGYLGPIAVGYAKDATGSFEAGFTCLRRGVCVHPDRVRLCAVDAAWSGGDWAVGGGATLGWDRLRLGPIVIWRSIVFKPLLTSPAGPRPTIKVYGTSVGELTGWTR